MKITDDYGAKYRIWAANPLVTRLNGVFRIPHFKSRKFSTHEEMNEWKSSVMRLLARTTVENE